MEMDNTAVIINKMTEKPLPPYSLYDEMPNCRDVQTNANRSFRKAKKMLKISYIAYTACQ